MWSACASPVQQPGADAGNPTARGPSLDLAGFIAAPSDDLARPATPDLSTVDLAMQSTPPDLATAPHDLAIASGCGAITYDGICMGDNLIYCNAGTLVTVDCWFEYLSSCEVLSGVADCYF